MNTTSTPVCDRCGFGINTYAHFTECVGGAPRPSGPPVGHGPAFRPFVQPTWCQFSWRLQGEKREVGCRLPYGHGGTFHRCGVFVTPLNPWPVTS